MESGWGGSLKLEEVASGGKGRVDRSFKDVKEGF